MQLFCMAKENPDETLLFKNSPKAEALRKQAKKLKRAQDRKAWKAQHGH